MCVFFINRVEEPFVAVVLLLRDRAPSGYQFLLSIDVDVPPKVRAVRLIVVGQGPKIRNGDGRPRQPWQHLLHELCTPGTLHYQSVSCHLHAGYKNIN